MLTGGRVIAQSGGEEFFPDGHTKKVWRITWQADEGATGILEIDRNRLADTAYVESALQAEIDAARAVHNLHIGP